MGSTVLTKLRHLSGADRSCQQRFRQRVRNGIVGRAPPPCAPPDHVEGHCGDQILQMRREGLSSHGYRGITMSTMSGR
jgi:hypothetical protein